MGIGCFPEDPVTGKPISRVGGTATGLNGGEVILDINGESPISIFNDGFFQFYFYPLAEGHAYNVTVLSQPFDQECNVENGLGVMGSEDKTDVNVLCSNIDPLISDIPFKDPAFEACVMSAASDQGAVFASELTSLSCESMGISSAMEVRYFTGLTSLKLANNDLSALDLASNVNLKSLALYRNAIVEIDLKSNKSLLYLFLAWNQIADIDVSENSELRTLSINNNQLTDINLDNNALLNTVKLQWNPLSSDTITYLGTLSIPDLVY